MGYYKNDPEEVKIAILNNLSNWSWDIYPEFRLEKEEVEVVQEMIYEQLCNAVPVDQLHNTSGKEAVHILKKIDEEYDFNSNTAFKVSQDEGDVIIEAIKKDRLPVR